MFQCSSASRKFLNQSSICRASRRPQRFSALQRAENSSMSFDDVKQKALQLFQCSSASRKFLNARSAARCCATRRRFQCSSASRKFLNTVDELLTDEARAGFSALQRAENSSIAGRYSPLHSHYTFQCSSASRKFLNFVFLLRRAQNPHVSVLFSEPKIPQF